MSFFRFLIRTTTGALYKVKYRPVVHHGYAAYLGSKHSLNRFKQRLPQDYSLEVRDEQGNWLGPAQLSRARGKEIRLGNEVITVKQVYPLNVREYNSNSSTYKFYISKGFVSHATPYSCWIQCLHGARHGIHEHLCYPLELVGVCDDERKVRRGHYQGAHSVEGREIEVDDLDKAMQRAHGHAFFLLEGDVVKSGNLKTRNEEEVAPSGIYNMPKREPIKKKRWWNWN